MGKGECGPLPTFWGNSTQKDSMLSRVQQILWHNWIKVQFGLQKWTAAI